jgi:hypothetical protein
VCAPKLSKKEARHLWKVEISAAAKEYISKVEISGPTPNKEKQVVVVFTKSSLLRSLKILRLLYLFSPRSGTTPLPIYFYFPKLSLHLLAVVVRLRPTLNLFDNRKHAHDLG